MIIEAFTAVAEHGDHFGPFAGGPGFFWPIIPIVWLVLVVGGIVTWIVLSRRGRAAAPRREAEGRLAARYAAGEIGEDEYRARRTVLREKG